MFEFISVFKGILRKVLSIFSFEISAITKRITWKLFLDERPSVTIFFSRCSIGGCINDLQHSNDLAFVKLFFWSCMIFKQQLSEFRFFYWLWVEIVFETMSANLKENIFNFSNIIMFRVDALAYVADEGLRFWYDYSFVVLLWGEVNQPPILQESMDSHYGADISK